MLPPRRRPSWASGTVTLLEHESRCLAANPWQDPTRRHLSVYLPPGYDRGRQRYPLLCYLAAYTNSGRSIGAWRAFGESLGERLDRLIGEGRMGPVVVIAPDCFTSLGGNQYVDSPGVGAYHSYVHDELLPFAEEQLRVLPGRAHRAVLGKSSGGFGALWFAMRRPDCWRALANHSGDCHFEVVVRRDFPILAAALARFDNDAEAFIEDFWARPAPSGSDIHALMSLCLAASYDPAPDGTIRLPVDLHTLELDPERWSRWLAHDPVHRLADHAEALKSLDRIYMDCGDRDQYHIHHGMRLLSREMERLGIAHAYEEFQGTHSGIDWRLDHSLPKLYEVIAP